MAISSMVAEKPVGQTTVKVKSDSTLLLPSRDWLPEGSSRLSIISGILQATIIQVPYEYYQTQVWY